MLRILLFPLLMALVAPVRAAGPVTWSFTVGTATDGTSQLELTATCESGWHIYALSLPSDDGPLPTVIRIPATEAFKAGDVVEPAPVEVDDPNFGMRVRYHSGTFTFVVPIQRSSPQAFDVTGEVEFMSCNDRTCLPPRTEKFTLHIPATKRR